MPSLLVTNDFPPKLGGIQSYLYELWRRLPPDETTVFTTPHPDAAAWDAQQPFRIVRARQKVLLPSAALARDVDALAREVDADVIFLDPMLPLGLIGPRLRSAPYVVIAHGAEITVPATVPGLRRLGRRVVRGAAAVVAAGGYPARQASRITGRDVRGVIVPPGVDAGRFRPADEQARAESRLTFGLQPDRPLVLGLSRLVPAQGLRRRDRRGRGPSRRAAGARGHGSRPRPAGATGAPERRRRDLPRPDLGTRPCPRSTRAPTCSRCAVANDGAGARGRGLRHRLPRGGRVRGSVGGRTQRRRARSRSSTARPASSSSRGTCTRFGSRSPRSATIRRSGDRMGHAARDRAVGEYSYDRLVARLLPIARGDLSAAGTLPR